MKKITKMVAKKLLLLSLFMLSFSGFAQNFSVCLGNGTNPTPTTFEVDIILNVNAPVAGIRLASVAFGVNYDPTILNGGTPCTTINCGTWTFIPGSRSPAIAALNNTSNTNRASPVGHLRATMTNLTGALSIDILPGSYTIGRYRFTNTVPFTANSNANLWLQPTNTGGSTNTIVSFYPYGATTPLAAYTTISPAGGTGLTLCQTATSQLPIILNPATICFTAGSATVTPETCAGNANGTATITMTPTPSDLNATYSLDGATAVPVTLTAGGAFTITGLSSGAHTLSVTGSGACTTPISVPFTITTNPTLTPTFTQVAPICNGATLAALPTTSNNGVIGTWAPVLDNTATTTYTFTPNGGQCATTTTMTIVVNPNPIVTFTANPFPVCVGTSTVLTATANNFSPTVNYVDLSAANQSQSIIPAAFGTPVTTPLSANLALAPSDGCAPFAPGLFTGKIALIQRGACSFAIKAENAQAAGAIGVILYNNVAGNLNVGGTSTATIPVYGTTLANGQALIAAMTANEVAVTLNPAPPLTYSWSNGSTTNTTTTGVLNVDTDFTVTVTNTATGCATTQIVTVPVTPNTVPLFDPVAAICAGETLATLPTTSTNGIAGSWAPALDNTTTTTYTFTPTPVAGQCLASVTLTITVNPLTTNGSVTTIACGSYTWPANGVTYTTNQTNLTYVVGCNTATLNLTIDAIDYANLQFPDTQSLCQGQTFTAYGRVYEAGITDASQTLQGTGIDVEFGLSPVGGSTNPSTWTNWAAASYNASSLCYPCNDDEYQYTAGAALTAGTYYYTFRYKLSSCTTWQYGGYPNGFWNGTTQNSGVLTINPLTTNGSVTTTACDTYTWAANGVTYTTSQTNVTHVVGCNTATLNLTINNSTTGTTTATACDTYTWAAPLGNGLTYTTSQTGITHVSTNAAGCPNTQTLNLTINNSTTGTTTATACDTYTWALPLGNGLTYTTSQTGITNVTTNAAGCPHTQTLNLIINNSTTGTTTATACDTYTWALPLGNGVTYTTSQTGITNTTTNAAGCPNTQTLNLTINNSTTGTTTATACDTYTWALPLGNGLTYTTSQTGITNVTTNAAGCPHTQTLNLTINNSTTGTTTATACNTYTWAAPLGNGLTYTTSQTGITHVSTNAAGCPNTQTLNLTMTTAATPTGSSTQSFSVATLNDATIANLVVSPSGVIWYGSLADAQSATNPLASTTVLTNGSTYWAVNVVGTCASTPFAVTVTVTLGNEDFDSLNFAYYPNPTSSTLNISYSKAITEIQITNMLGQVILTKKTNDTEVQVDLAPFAEATYFVKVTSEDKSKIVKVIKRN